MPNALVALPVGKALTSVAALLPAVGAFVADWNETHVFNPKWPPHAKFHNAQTITFASVAGAISLWQTWRPGPDDLSRVRWATVLGGLFWATQVPAAFFPGTALADPDSPHQPSVKFGVPVNQITAIAAIVLPLLTVGYRLQVRHLPDSTPR